MKKHKKYRILRYLFCSLIALLFLPQIAASSTDCFMWGFSITWPETLLSCNPPPGVTDPELSRIMEAIDKTVNVAGSGSWLRLHLIWSDIEPSILYPNLNSSNDITDSMVNEYIQSTSNNWLKYDQIVNYANLKGVNIIFILGAGYTIGPKNFLPYYNGVKLSEALVPGINDYKYLAFIALHARAAVRKYKDFVHLWQLENELNVAAGNIIPSPWYWRSGNIWLDPHFLTSLIDTMSLSVKQEDEDTKVYTNFHCLVPWSIQDWAPYLDIIGLDIYWDKLPPWPLSWVCGGKPNIKDRIDEARSYSAAATNSGGIPKPILIAEIGYNGSTSPLTYDLELEQANWVAESALDAYENGALGYLYYTISTEEFNPNHEFTEDYMGLMRRCDASERNPLCASEMDKCEPKAGYNMYKTVIQDFFNRTDCFVGISVNLILNKTNFTVGEELRVTASIKLENGYNVDGATVTYNVKNPNNIIIRSGTLAPLGNGRYQGSFAVPDIPGNYTIEVTATKTGYQDGFGAASFTVNQPDPRFDAAVEDVDWVNPPLDDFQVDIGETISGNILVKNYGTVTTDIPIVLEIVGTGRSSTTTVYSVEPGKTKISSLLGINTTGLTSGFYTIQVRTDLAGDSNVSNNILTRNVLIGQQTIIPNRLPLQSYKLYFRKYEGPLQTTPAVTISAGALSYTIIATYVDNSSSSFNISGVGTFRLYKDKLYSIDTDNDGQVDHDKLFIAISGNSYSPGTNTYYFEFQVGIYDENTNVQQINPDRVVNRIASCTGSLSGMAGSAKAKYDYYLEPGESTYYAFLHAFNPELNQNTLDGYICRWSFNNRDSLGSPVGNYGGSLYMYYNFTSSGRIEDYYVIVPNSTIPSGDYDFLIIQEQVIDTTGSDFFRYLGYAHSVRMRVVDYHEAEVTSVVLPPTMQSGGSYTIQVQIKNNGDGPENNIPVSLNITNNYGYNPTINKNSGNIPAGTTQAVDFTWETLGLPSDTYTFSAFISVNGDQNTDNNSKSAQQQLLPPYLLSINGSIDKPEYGEGEVITLNVSVKDDLQNAVSGVSVSYKVKKAGVEVNAGVAQDQGNGNYFDQFGAPYIPGNYSIEINASKIGYLSGLNNSLTFLVKDTIKPTIPILYSPGNDATVSSTQINFDWYDSVDSGSGVARYQIQVSMNMDFSPADIDLQPETSNYTATLSPGTFYWRVRSIDNASNQSDWSAVWQFTINISPPPDTTPPTPNPMTWATPPNAAGSTSISMVATTATDTGSPPISYYFDFVDSPTGGSGGADSGWQSSTSYTNAGLQPNHQYGYQVKARDSASTPNETSPSSPIVYTCTLANAPVAAAFSNVTETSIRANWTDGGNSSGTQYYCENTTMGTNSGPTATTYWDSSGLSCGTSYSFRVKAINGDGIDTGWTDLGTQATQPCPIPPVINPISDGSIGEGAPYTGPTPSLSQGTPPVTWSLVAGPSGMSINSSTGLVSWANPTSSGSPHTITIQATNTAGSDTKSWQLTITPSAGVLSITPSDGLNSSGSEGGPFDPSSKNYTLENTGGVSINWTASKTQGWVTLTATGGSLAAGASTTVSVSINSTANSLAAATYYDSVTFTNTTNGNGNTTRGVALTINSPTQPRVLYITTNQNPLIMDVLANNGLDVSISTAIPSDMSAYALVIVSAYAPCYLQKANYLKNYVANDGRVILTDGTPAFLASASPGGSTGDLSAIADWFGAGFYGNVGPSLAHISYNHPFDTTLLQGAAVGLCTGSGGATILKDSLSAESDIIAEWDYDSNSIFSFTHTYGNGRVYYTAAQPSNEYEQASTELFDGAIKWTRTTTTVVHCVSNVAGLQAALTAAQSNGKDDLIKVVQGSYTGNFSYSSSEGHSITLQGGYTAGCSSRVVNPTNTILDGSGSGRVLYLNNSSGGDIQVDGFTIQNGNSGGSGGGISAVSESSSGTAGQVTITNNIVTGNSTEYGGGVYAHSFSSSGKAGDVIINNNIIIGNSAHSAGGVDVISNSIGGGTAGTVTITNNTITGNIAEYSGGAELTAYDDSMSGTVNCYNNIIWGNTATYAVGDINLFAPTANGYNNDYTNMAGSWTREDGNINENPLFVGSGDYHLRAGSPCINAGDNDAPFLPATDFEGDPRVIGSAPDIGADEFSVVPTDFNADRIPDILWRNPSTGANAFWYMGSDGRVIKSTAVAPSYAKVWKVAGVADFDGDGVPDILWRNPGTGANAIWYMQSNGTAIKSQAVVPSYAKVWVVGGVADFDADGVPDILWRNPGTGANAIWYMQSNGTAIKSQAVVPSYAKVWVVGGVADFDADGVPDILWRNPGTGANAIWYMQSNGTVIKRQAVVPSCHKVWKVGKVADFDGDGVPDILWRHPSTGAHTLWYMDSDGTVINSIAPVPGCSKSWDIGG